MKENKKKIIMIFVSLLSLFVIIFTIYMITKNNVGGMFNYNLKIDLKYQILLYLGTLMLSLSLLSLIINIKNRDKLIIYILSSIILFTIFNIVSYQGINFLMKKNATNETQEKDKVTLDESNVVSEENINLNNYDTDITITEEGTYYLYTGGTNSGRLSYGIYQNNKYSEGTKIEINNVSEFTVSKTVNLYGNKGR